MAACKTFLMGKCIHFEGHIAHLEALRSPIVKTKKPKNNQNKTYIKTFSNLFDHEPSAHYFS